ncbi:DinB family protein [Chitinophaga solisilvae]|uniref:DinB family protein n=1 Tax=Chitinophaga solisilvae TaxID=1233460 RepID=UPI00136C7048|nr:DinB family protein [Chitinophaga solisilvae]
MILTATTSGNTTLTEMVKEYTAYNLWANKALVEWLRTHDAALLEKEVPSSFSSIKATLHHIYTTENWWLSNLRNENPQLEYGAVFTGTVAEALSEVLAVSTELNELVRNYSAEELEETCEVVIPFTGTFDIPRAQIINHIMCHSIYHRGQVVTIGRNVGVTGAQNTDYMYYQLLGKGEQVG